MAKKILITGGAGFIGSNLALSLLDKDYDITVLDNLSPQIHGEDGAAMSPLYLSIRDKVNFIKGDVRNREDWARALKGQQIIVHLAAETGTGQSMYEIEKYVDVNIKGTAILLDLLTNNQHTVKKVVVASSRAIYGEGKYRSSKLGILYPRCREDLDMAQGHFEPKCPETGEDLKLLATDEESKIHPTSVYGITKQNQEQMVLTVCQSLGVSAIAYRYQNVYGPGQSLSNPYTGILSIFSTSMKNGNDINIYEDGLESRDFVYIDDVVNATTLGIENDEVQNEVFGVGSGVPTSVIEVASKLKEYYQADVALNISGNYRLGDIRHNYADLTKISRRLSYQPQFTFEQGLRLFVDWVNRQDVQEDKYERSIAEMKNKGLFK